ncbi:MAG: 4Fe-4S dicluster-binding protein [Patescibacteria group bacterium]|jgi:2-oxoacid:acceptor oxidoreductase delta subunit (pyruvate/2-ketoisovalerate family)
MKNSNKKLNLITKPGTSLLNKTGAWRTARPITDFNVCISCQRCAKICPEACIAMKKITKFPKLKPVTDYNYCKGCALCARECPVKAIKMKADY